MAWRVACTRSIAGFDDSAGKPLDLAWNKSYLQKGCWPTSSLRRCRSESILKIDGYVWQSLSTMYPSVEFCLPVCELTILNKIYNHKTLNIRHYRISNAQKLILKEKSTPVAHEWWPTEKGDFRIEMHRPPLLLVSFCAERTLGEAHPWPHTKSEKGWQFWWVLTSPGMNSSFCLVLSSFCQQRTWCWSAPQCYTSDSVRPHGGSLWLSIDIHIFLWVIVIQVRKFSKPHTLATFSKQSF